MTSTALGVEGGVREPGRQGVAPAAARQGSPLAERVPVPPLWRLFVAGWLLVFVVVVAGPGHGTVRAHFATEVAGIVLLAGLYLRLTLRGALTAADLAPGGPPPGLVRRRAAELAAMTGVVYGLVLLTPGEEMWWLGMHVVVAAGLALPPRLAAAWGICLVALSLGAARVQGGRFDVMLLIQVAFGAGAVAIRQLSITVSQLRTARGELARAAVDEERLRFARDLHDLLGHSLSMIALKSELAGRLVAEAPDRAAVEIGDVERAARDALRQVRAAVAGYRQPSLRGELAAARELLAAAGITARVHDAAGTLPPALDSLLAWAVREGVTNVIRHARARCCTIRVGREGGGRARVEISDDGCGPEQGALVAGHGLAGLAERAAAHGGVLRAGPRPQAGFVLVMEAAADGGGRP